MACMICSGLAGVFSVFLDGRYEHNLGIINSTFISRAILFAFHAVHIVLSSGTLECVHAGS